MSWKEIVKEDLNKGIGDKMGAIMSSGQHNASPKTKEIRAGIKVARKELANAIDKATNNTNLEEFQQALDEMKELTMLFNQLSENTHRNFETMRRGREAAYRDKKNNREPLNF